MDAEFSPVDLLYEQPLGIIPKAPPAIDSHVTHSVTHVRSLFVESHLFTSLSKLFPQESPAGKYSKKRN